LMQRPEITWMGLNGLAGPVVQMGADRHERPG
jgi:hypothetical protein